MSRSKGKSEIRILIIKPKMKAQPVTIQVGESTRRQTLISNNLKNKLSKTVSEA